MKKLNLILLAFAGVLALFSSGCARRTVVHTYDADGKHVSTVVTKPYIFPYSDIVVEKIVVPEGLSSNDRSAKSQESNGTKTELENKSE